MERLLCLLGAQSGQWPSEDTHIFIMTTVISYDSHQSPGSFTLVQGQHSHTGNPCIMQMMGSPPPPLRMMSVGPVPRIQLLIGG